MGVPVLTPPLVHDNDALAEDVMHLLQVVVDQMDGQIDRDNLKDGEVLTAKLADLAVTYPKLGNDVTALLATLGSNLPGGAIHRGKTIIATEESSSSNAFTTLTTPDLVSNIVLPANGLLRVNYLAYGKGTGTPTQDYRAAIFIRPSGGAWTQLKVNVEGQAAPQTEEARSTGGAQYQTVASCAVGLVTYSTVPGGGADMTAVATGQVLGLLGLPSGLGNGATLYWGGSNNVNLNAAMLGGPCVIRGLPAGTYDVSVQWKAQVAGGVVWAKNRELYVEAVGF
jgi:hypothetical protein